MTRTEPDQPTPAAPPPPRTADDEQAAPLDDSAPIAEDELVRIAIPPAVAAEFAEFGDRLTVHGQ